MNLKIENKRAITTSAYDPRMVKVLPHLEGTKRWGQNRTFSFENTRYNIRLWVSVFPNAVIDGLDQPEATETTAVEAFDVQALRPTFQFKTPPRGHQIKALAKFHAKREFPNVFGLFMDIGTGKSWTGIAIMGQLWCANQIDAVLLVAKNGVHSQWVEQQIPEHISDSVKWKACVWGKSKKGQKAFDDLLQFDGLKVFSINIDAIATKPAEERILQFINANKGRVLMIVDESQDIKNISALRTKAAIKYGALCRYRVIMTGTPLAKNLVDAYSQFKFLDERIFGHKYMTTFRARYCVLRSNGFGPVIVGHQNVEEFYRVIDPYVFRITSAEALDLPPQVFVTHEFAMNDEQKKIIKELRQTFSAQLDTGERVNITNAASMITKMQQISCGFVVDEDGKSKRIANTRLEALKNVLEQREGKAIIWCRFNEDIRAIMEELGDVAVDYYGKTPEDNRAKNVKAFLDADSPVKYLVASPEAAGTGLNLQGICRTNIYFSNSYNSLARWQSEGRTWRDGTTGTVTYIDLIAKGSPDRKILQNLRDKKDISNLALDEYRKLLIMEDADETL